MTEADAVNADRNALPVAPDHAKRDHRPFE